jgi:hypothetical protein
MYYFIIAHTESYGTLHGMYDYELDEYDTYEEACERGLDLAREVVDRYLHVDDIYSEEDYMSDNGIDEWDECYRDNYWDVFNEAREAECAFEIYQLKDGYNEDTFRVWEKENMPPDDFINRYCENIDFNSYIKELKLKNQELETKLNN